MKKRSPINKLTYFLEHLESNLNNPKSRTLNKLESSFPPTDQLKRLIDLCLKEDFIYFENDFQNQNDSAYSLTLAGLKFLEELRKSKIEKQNQKIQQILVHINVILAITTISMALDNFYFPYVENLRIILLSLAACISIYVGINFYLKG